MRKMLTPDVSKQRGQSIPVKSEVKNMTPLLLKNNKATTVQLWKIKRLTKM